MPAILTININENNELSLKGDMTQASDTEKDAAQSMMAAYLTSIGVTPDDVSIKGYASNDELESDQSTKH